MSNEIRKKHIVMVDDEPVNLELAENALKENYKLTKLISGAQLLTFLKRIRPDMILLDVQMPDKNGFEVMGQIMGDPKTKNIPVIFLTGQEDSKSETIGFSLGAIDFIKKPFDSDSMLARIGSHMKHFGHKEEDSQKFTPYFAATFPGFLSIRNSKHQIVYLNENFRNWIKLYTDVEPVGKTNIEIAGMVPKNVGDTFLQCHDGSLDLQSRGATKAGLKKVIEFKGKNELIEDSQFFDVLKYTVFIEKEPHIFTIAYDITELYKENQQNLNSSITDSMTGAFNRRYFIQNKELFYGHYAALIDLDNFKMINDREGHCTGDKVLHDFVSFLKVSLSGLIGAIRLGGDEFVTIFANGVKEDQLHLLLVDARKKFEGLYSNYPYLSFSYGIGLIDYEIEETINSLDKKMYRNKERIK